MRLHIVFEELLHLPFGDALDVLLGVGMFTEGVRSGHELGWGCFFHIMQVHPKLILFVVKVRFTDKATS